MTTPEAEVRIERAGPIATLVLHQPARRNAMTSAMWDQLARHATELGADDEVRCIVLRGSGEEAFVAGADISEFTQLRENPDQARRYDELTDRAFQALLALDTPVIAAIHGFCMGGGTAIALCCDLRFAADDARFALPPARLGLGYGLENVRNAVNVLGTTAARELLLTARRIPANEALRLGLLSAVVPKAELDSLVQERAAAIAENAPLTLQAVKRSLRALESGNTDALAEAQQAIDRCFSSEDYAEGVRAFLEKRRPVFRGR